MRLTRHLLAALFAFLIIAPVCSAATPSETVPGDAVCLLTVKVKSTDPGVQWILTEYKRWFLGDKFGKEAQNIVGDFNILEFSEISLGLLLDADGKPQYLGIGDIDQENTTVTFKYKNLNLKLRVKERDETKGLQQGIVTALLKQWMGETSEASGAEGILFSASRAAKGDICAYTFVNNRVILGSAVPIVRDAQLASSGEATVPPMKENLSSFLKNLTAQDDGYLFIDNRTGYLTTFMRNKESIWKIPVLISGDSLDSAGIVFNVVDNNTATLCGYFHAKDPSQINVIAADVQFMAEFLRRKMLAEGIVGSYTIEKKGTDVVVLIDCRNIEGFIKKLLKMDKPSAPNASNPAVSGS